MQVSIAMTLQARTVISRPAQMAPTLRLVPSFVLSVHQVTSAQAAPNLHAVQESGPSPVPLLVQATMLVHTRTMLRRRPRRKTALTAITQSAAQRAPVARTATNAPTAPQETPAAEATARLAPRQRLAVRTTRIARLGRTTAHGASVCRAMANAQLVRKMSFASSEARQLPLLIQRMATIRQPDTM